VAVEIPTHHSNHNSSTVLASPTGGQPRGDPVKMKKYASFDDYLDDQPPKNRSIIRALRRFVKRVESGLEESVKWGNGCWVKGKVPISYVYSAPDHVQFGFIRGSALKDPRGLLEGNGKYVRHVKVRKPSDIDEDVFKAFLRQAAR
jgi:hypothetical protein